MQRYQSGIYQILIKRFDESELRTLCFNLGVDYDILMGPGKSDKARELISFLDRRNSIADLISIGKEMRPDIDWVLGKTQQDSLSENAAPPKDDAPYSDPSRDLLKTALMRLGYPTFVFHRPELENQALDYVLRGVHPVTLIQGLPGSGKTTMLCEIAISMNQNYSNTFAVKFSGPFTLEPAYFIEEINQFMTELNCGVDPILLKTQDTHRSLQTISNHFSQLGHAILLLDSVDEAPPGLIESFLQMLPLEVKVVLTARSRVVSRAKAQVLVVPPLQESESEELVNQYLNAQRIEIPDKDWVIHLPKRIKESPHALTLFMANLRDIPLDLLLQDELQSLTFDLASLVRKIIKTLHSDVAHLLALLLLFEHQDLSASFRVLNFKPRKGFVESLQVLLEKSLIYRQNEFYRVPSVVREVVTDSIPEVMDETVREMVQIIKGVIDDLRIQKTYNKLAELLTITADFCFRLSQLKSYDSILKLATEEFLELINVRGFWKEYWLILRIAFEAAKQVNDGPAIALIGFRIIRKSFQVKDLQTGRQALTELENTLEIVPGTKLQAEFLSHKALFTEQDDHIDAALEELQESLLIHKKLEDPEAVSLLQKLIGNIYIRRHEISKARESYDLALAQIGEGQVLSKHHIEVEISLALCDFIERDFNSAQIRLQENIKKCRETGYLAGLPKAYYFLALVLDSQSQYEDALHNAKLAAELALSSERTVATGALMLVWKIKNQDLQKPEDTHHEG